MHAEAPAEASLEIFLMSSSGGAIRPKGKYVEEPPSIASQSEAPAQKAEDIPTTQKSDSSKAKPAKMNPVKQTQGVLDLESYQRGRFDKSEPTIVAGQDLDIPTFIRKGIKLASPHRN